MLLLVKIYKAKKKQMKKKQTVICYLFKKLTFNCPVFFQQFHVNSQTLSYRIIKVLHRRKATKAQKDNWRTYLV